MCVSTVFIALQCCVFRSGTEEEYGELEQLLEDISSYMEDFAVQKAETKEKRDQKKRKEEEDKRKRLEMRRAAMEGLSSMLFQIQYRAKKG